MNITKYKTPRTGCPECYGKLNCGCPDCYVPEYKRGKKKRVTLELESVDIIPQLEYSACTAVARVEGEGALVAKVTKAVVRTQVDFLQMFIMSWSLSQFSARRSLSNEDQGLPP